MEFFMKKSILASSIAAAVFGLGATGAQAALSASTTGLGDILIVPYFTAQAENATLLTITNTDTTNGKAVKVRFRGAANSDDLIDFQVFMSPGDVWTANISKGSDGRAKLATTDTSCTKPAIVNASFSTARIDPTLTGDAAANGTREGYIEIIGMADIPKTNTTYNVIATSSTDLNNPLFTAIKHVKGVAPCTASGAFAALDRLSTTAANFVRLDNSQANSNTTAYFALTSGLTNVGAAYGLTPSTGGLMANWTIINTVSSAAFHGEAYAFVDDSVAGTAGSGRLNNYFPQTPAAISAATATAYTADPLFLKGTEVQTYNKTNQTLNAATTVTTITSTTQAARYDLPDVTTPFDATGSLTPTANMVQLQSQMGKASVIAEFATESAINGSTDWQFTMPTRRYAVAMAYNKITSTDDGRRFNAAYQSFVPSNGIAASAAAFNAQNTTVNTANIICVTGAAPVAYDREEQTATSGVVLSPQVLGQVSFCGESSVLSWNNGTASSALKAALTVYPVDVAPFSTGWAKMVTSTTAGDAVSTVNLPFVGGAFIKASNGAQGYGIYQSYR